MKCILLTINFSLHFSCPDASTTESCQGSKTGAGDVSMWSGETETDKGLELSQQMMTDCHSLLPGAELQLENEEYLMNISSRLQAAVEKLLVAITETTNQVRHSKVHLVRAWCAQHKGCGPHRNESVL